MKIKQQKNNQIYNVKIKSAVHPDIYHVVQMDLNCHEKMPSEKQLSIRPATHMLQIDLNCYEKMPSEEQLNINGRFSFKNGNKMKQPNNSQFVQKIHY